MKKLILILWILAVMVMASGCVSNTPTNKTYSNNGISFTYPGGWIVQNGTANNILVSVGNESSAFALANNTIRNNQRIPSSTEWAAVFNSSMIKNGYIFVYGKPRTVDGVNGYEIALIKAGNYTSSTYFVKNRTEYTAAFIFNGNDIQTSNNTINMVLNSLKVP